MPSGPEIFELVKSSSSGMTRQEIAQHFGVKKITRSNGKRCYPGNLNKPLTTLVRDKDLLALHNGELKIFVVHPARL